MRPLAVIAHNDIRRFLRDKASWFWLFGAPLLFASFLGMANRGPGAPSNPKPSLRLENHDDGFASRLLVEELGLHGLSVVTNNAERGLRIPTNFTASVLGKKPVKVELYRSGNSSEDAAAMVEFRLLRALVALNGHLIEQDAKDAPASEASLRALLDKPDPVQLDTSFATRRPIPVGYNQSVPGILVMFTLMNLLIFGGATLAHERREGLIRRLLIHPMSRRQLILGKIAGLLCLGAVQMGFLLLFGRLVLGFQVAANPLLLGAILGVYAWTAGSIGILIGSVLAREDKIVAVCVLASMVMAALGGCWWPLEIVPEHVRWVGHLFPTAWAMDALHQLLSFGGGLAEIRSALAVLLLFAVASTWGAIRYFRA
jgi:ABC-2 type transport system permease protein